MIAFAASGFLVAGALLALVPLALHLLARTPPDRRPLPTARFLTVDRRTQLRVRRPTDPLLLALRVLFILLLATAFARPEWLPERTGASVVVLLDTGAEMAPVWDDALAAARDRLGSDGTLVVFDSIAHVMADPDAALDSLRAGGPGAGAASYLAGLRGLKAAAETLPAESATAALVTLPRWGAWSPGVAAAREAAWPARIDVVGLDVPRDQTDGAAPGVEGGASGVDGGASGANGAAAAVIGAEDHPLRPYATAALRALGYAPASDTTAGLVLVLSGTGAAGPRPAPQATHVVFLGGPLTGRGGVDGPVPWAGTPDGPEVSPRSRGRLVLPGGRAMEGWTPRAGAPADGFVVIAVWEDGRPAAAATLVGESCRAYLAAEPATSAAAADPSFPWLLRALASGCTPAGVPTTRAEKAPADDVSLDGLPLDRGALAVLRGGALPAAADLLSAEGPRRRPLARLLTVLALLVALIEAAITYGRREAR